MRVGKRFSINILLTLLILAPGPFAPGPFASGPFAYGAAHAAAKPGKRACREVVLHGEVQAGREWHAGIGEGWVFRVLPISMGHDLKGYTGWDMVMDRESGVGYPDALLLATPPYGSLNEREIGTTFGLRAQDAIAWGPRRFRFFTDMARMSKARNLFAVVMPLRAGGTTANANSAEQAKATQGLLSMLDDHTAMGDGELSILDARLVSGVADPPEFARQWAARLSQVPHTNEQTAGAPSALGELRWMRFAVTLRLPAPWKLPAELHGTEANCEE